MKVRDDARFAVVGVDTDAQIGDSGTLTVELENTGEEAAYKADVGLTSTASGLTFGGADTSMARIGELAPGETGTVTYDVTISPDTPVREYAINANVRFEDTEGISRTDESLSFGVFPREEQEFTVDDVSSDLRVGEDGDLIGTVTNDGPAPARNVVVQYVDDSPNVIPIEDSVAVGTLEAGESAEFRLPLEISGEAEAIDRVADVAVRYRNDDGELRRYEDVEAVYAVGEDRDDFLVEVDDREVEAGSTQTVDVTVTNNLDEPVSDVEARLFADSPLDSEDDEGFTESLDPGESTTMTFTLSADGGATAKTYPVSFDFRYDDADGNSQLSDTSRVAITLVESEGGFPLFSVFGLLVTVAVAGGAVYYTQRE
ncbi:MAG: S-layer domain protein [uncultured archaeon A07HR67]|nr:MAG: S-layer domain protein [uncultured archaeon A07HR67]